MWRRPLEGEWAPFETEEGAEAQHPFLLFLVALKLNLRRFC